MNTLLVGYDLNGPGQNYTDLITRLKSFAWWHHLDSTWLVRTTLTAAELRTELKKHLLDGDDELLVLDVTGDSWATSGISDSGNAWLRNNL